MNNIQEPITRVNYDLEERVSLFSESIIDFLKIISRTEITKPLINQLVRSATSVGANYCEASEASSKKDFINKISISKKECRETKYWLRLIAHTLPEHKESIRTLWKEAQELNLIFAASIRTAKGSL